MRPCFPKLLSHWERALVGIALCSFTESSLAQDAVTAPVDIDDLDGDDIDDGNDKAHQRRSQKSGSVINADGGWLAYSRESLSLAITSAAETAEVERVVVTGTWFDAYPVPYPALPLQGCL
jgi:hypothetical protein